MFTKNQISLIHLLEGMDCDVLRDADVSFVAKVPNRLARRLVPCSERSHLVQAISAEGVAGVIVPNALVGQVPSCFGLVVAENPVATAIIAHERLAAMPDFLWTTFQSKVSTDSRVEDRAYIAPFDVVIGSGVIIQQGAVILPRTIIGDGSVIGPGSIVGCDAFQVAKVAGRHRIIRQVGGVRIGTNVEIQANCTVSRAIFGGFTEVGDETLIDSQVHIGHDCTIGRKVLIANQASIAGRVEVGDNCYLAPNVTISNGLSLAEGSQVTIGSVLMRNTKPGEKVTGYNAQTHQQWMLQSIRAQRLK
jgi:UDP-3-O-[3-hydroxymyristoyl] glucosamine N-acyltransferase LpxD